MLTLSVASAPLSIDTLLTIVLIVIALCAVVYFAPKLPAIAQYFVYGALVLIALIFIAIRLGVVG